MSGRYRPNAWLIRLAEGGRFERVIIALALVVAATIATVSHGSAAYAARACDTFANRFAGYYHNPDSAPSYYFEGASSYIVPRLGNLCSGKTKGNFTNAWAMIGSRVYGSYGQVGYIISADHEPSGGQPPTPVGLRWFSQFSASGGNNLSTWYSANAQYDQVGVRHAFRVLYDVNCSCLKATIDTTKVAQSNFNPYASSSGWGSGPWIPQFAGEVGFLNSDITGSTSAHTNFTSLGAQRVADDVLQAMPCTMLRKNDNTARWKVQSSGCDAFDIWTGVL